MTDKTQKRPDQTTLDLAVLGGLFRDKHTAFFAGIGGAILLMGLLGASGALDDFIFWKTYNRYGEDQAALRISLVTSSGLLGFGLGWFFSPGAAIARAFILGALGGALTYLTIVDQAVIGWSAATVFAWIVFVMGLGYWARAAMQRFMTPPKTFGDSAWASDAEIEAAGLFDPNGVRIGYRDHQETSTPLYYGGAMHGFLCAPSRTHKGTSVIIPTLLTYPGSIVVIDPKGENAMITAERRRAMGHEVNVVDPHLITGMEPSCYNPLDEMDAGDVSLVDDCMMLAEAIIMSSEKEPFWTDAAKGIVQGLIGYIATDPDERGERHLGRLRDLIMMHGEDQQTLFKRMAQSSRSFVANTGRQYLQMDEKTLSNVLATVQSQTQFLESPGIRESLSRSDFSFSDLKTKAMSIYLALSSDKLDSHGRFLRLLIEQALSLNARNIEQQPEEPVLFILDEMPALGRLPMVEKAFGLMAGYGLCILAVCQNLSQLKSIYGDGWESFVANAGVIQYFGSRDKFTADYFSSLCGVQTVWSLSNAIGRSVSKSFGANGSESTSTSSTETTSAVQRQLAYPDQLMRMDQTKQLVFVGNMNPIIADKKPWFEDSELKDLGVNLHAVSDERQTDDDSGDA
jgi:type IV secretion system protein VirD4